MVDRKIVVLLRLLTKKELKSLQKFVQSPYFNTDPSIITLLDFIVKFAPDYKNKKFTIKNTHQAVYGNQNYSEKAITRLVSKLTKSIERFIVYDKFKDEEVQHSISLMAFYNQRKESKLFESAHYVARKLLADQSITGLQYYKEKFLLEYEFADFLSIRDDRVMDINIGTASEAFEAYYWLQRLMLLCQEVNRNNIVLDSSKRKNDAQLVVEILQNHKLLEIPIISAYYNALCLLCSQDSQEQYYKFKVSFTKNIDHFPYMDCLNLMIFLVNAIVKVFPKGESLYQEYFDISLLRIEKGLVFVKGFILPGLLKNIITVAIKINKLKWAEDFLKENKDKINEEEVYNWNFARIYFKGKKYEKVQDYLLESNYNDMFYILGTRRLKLKLYYETKEFDMLDHHINSFRVFLSRKDIDETFKKNNQGFVNFVQRLLSLAPYQSKGKNALIEKINAATYLSDRDWLLEKAQEF